ncbi:MAG: DNA helicase RecQ [Candidatus Hydrogenedentes bacterium]|nr:DNA helicase RecQ [Candidatus Hydrogenedentota bacterium]
MSGVNLSGIVKQYWGYDTLRPLQARAMDCVIENRDSLVVLPTGGGKSLCFQAPALAMDGLAVVISPLISLMKDQVGALRAVGVAAGCINSSMTGASRRETHQALQSGTLKLLYVAPERVVQPAFIEYLKKLRLSFIAVDEAHCISQWGHDFRPEYRALECLRGAIPGIALHCYTATATPHVQTDICASMGLRSPEIVIGSFVRPNLIYSTERRTKLLEQVLEVIGRHQGESGIIYCITRKKVDELCAQLRAHGLSALPYHAGLDASKREEHQEAFSREGAEIIVATVAFGMGIDKPDVRYVVHTGMPKSIEHYQQESGRAGRDGLDAECRLFYSGSDFQLWKTIMGDEEGASSGVALTKLNDMYSYCTGMRCRHQVLTSYFGERLEKSNCGACDICLGSADLAPDGLTIAQKILSCIVRLGELAGPSYTTLILTGSREPRVVEKRHDKLSTWGLLREIKAPLVRDWIEQLAEQEYVRKQGEYNILEVTERGRDLLRGVGAPRLSAPGGLKKSVARTAARGVSAKGWGQAERELFEALRALRREIAAERHAPALTVFGDLALRDMVLRRPVNKTQFLEVAGVGEKKCRDYADLFLPVIREHQERMQDENA